MTSFPELLTESIGSRCFSDGLSWDMLEARGFGVQGFEGAKGFRVRQSTENPGSVYMFILHQSTISKLHGASHTQKVEN